MEDLTLTDQQKHYLLYLEDFADKNTISDLSKHFECSRTNSKKILDKMVKIGILYKEDSQYLLTSFGREFSKELNSGRDDISKFINSIFFLDKRTANQYANWLMVSKSELASFLVEKSRKFRKSPLKKKTLDYTEIKNILGDGKFPLSFVIYKNESGEKNSNIAFSMANKAYKERAFIEIDKNDCFVSFHSKALEKKHQGYFKKGILQELYYNLDGKEHIIISKNSEARVPLEVFSKWQCFGNGIFCSNIWIKHKVSIGLITHSRKSNYLVILNLAET